MRGCLRDSAAVEPCIGAGIGTWACGRLPRPLANKQPPKESSVRGELRVQRLVGSLEAPSLSSGDAAWVRHECAGEKLLFARLLGNPAKGSTWAGAREAGRANLIGPRHTRFGGVGRHDAEVSVRERCHTRAAVVDTRNRARCRTQRVRGLSLPAKPTTDCHRRCARFLTKVGRPCPLCVLGNVCFWRWAPGGVHRRAHGSHACPADDGLHGLDGKRRH